MKKKKLIVLIINVLIVLSACSNDGGDIEGLPDVGIAPYELSESENLVQAITLTFSDEEI